MSRRILLATLLTCLVVQSGCVSLSMTEEAEWGKLLNEDIVDEPMSHKSPWLAGILSFIIPGVGHFYLGEWGVGGGLFLSNILWPLSVIWGTPAGVIDTKSVNKRYTVNYYTYGPGREVIEAKEREEMFLAAKGYVKLMMQRRGNRQISQSEITDFLFLKDFDRDYITNLDWHELEYRTGAQFYMLRPSTPPVLMHTPMDPQAGESEPQPEDPAQVQAPGAALAAPEGSTPPGPPPVSAPPPE